MRIEKHELRRRTTPGTDVLDLTGEVETFVAGTGIGDGWVTVFVPGSTASVTTLEFESGAINDLKRAIERLAPQDLEYEHNLRWGDGNGHSHVRAALLGPSLTLPIVDGRVEHGTWQQIILCDFDNKPRDRRIRLQAMGA